MLTLRRAAALRSREELHDSGLLGALPHLAASNPPCGSENYRLWRDNPRHPGLHFKAVGPNTWSVRVGENYRAVAAPVQGGFVWFWIGPHKDYERLVASLQRG